VNTAAFFGDALLAAGNAGLFTFATHVTAGDPTVAEFYNGNVPGAPLLVGQGANFIVDTNPNTTGISGLVNQLTLHPVKVSAGFVPGQFLIAYQATDGVHIAEDTVSAGGFLVPSIGGIGASGVHDIIDLVGTNITSLNTAAAVAHLVHFTA
jgi:hypothetical protein